MEDEIAPRVADFYRQVLRVLKDAGISFLVGGAFAHFCHTGIRRSTKDLDLFIRREDYEQIAELARQNGWRTEMSYPHWLGKVHHGDEFVDLIYNSGNGLTPVDERWFRGNREADVLGVPVLIANVEDALLSKAFIMERERYDGGDVAHLLQANAEQLDWPSLLDRFGAHWRVLLAHITLFGYIYPRERHHVPDWVVARLVAQLAQELREPAALSVNVCAGTLLSREQYLHDVTQRGYLDGRLTPASTMTQQDVATWTEAIPDKKE
ncbi:MAG: hypothetical protein EON54_13430 [Alcaligenaceae bacterium]|nr:MAG: hypothetical protein EON54_13430 [Alcaligenaceae bacterium]